MIDIGMLMPMTIVLPKLRRKRNSTMMASSPPVSAESATPAIEFSIYSAELMIALSLTCDPNSTFSFSISLRTLFATLTVFAPDCL